MIVDVASRPRTVTSAAESYQLRYRVVRVLSGGNVLALQREVPKMDASKRRLRYTFGVPPMATLDASALPTAGV